MYSKKQNQESFYFSLSSFFHLQYITAGKFSFVEIPKFANVSGFPGSNSLYYSSPQPFWCQFHGRQFFHRLGVGDGLGMIQAHHIYCAFYISYYYIVIYNEKIMQITIMQIQSIRH